MLCLMHFVANTKNEALLGENGLLYWEPSEMSLTKIVGYVKILTFYF